MSNNSAELLKEFLGTNKNAKTILDKDAFYKVDLLSMDSRAIMEYCIAYSVSISTELPMVQKIRANMNLFFQYAQQKGYIQHNVFDDPGFERKEILTDDLITYFLDKAADRKLTWYECFGEKYKIVSIDTYNNEETIKILLYRH